MIPKVITQFNATSVVAVQGAEFKRPFKLDWVFTGING